MVRNHRWPQRILVLSCLVAAQRSFRLADESFAVYSGASQDNSLLWNSLFEDPSQWTDFRASKRNNEASSNFPDFKSKDGRSLWISSKTPDFAHAKLVSGKQTWSLPLKRASSSLNPVPSPAQATQAGKSALWASVFQDPNQWTDFREEKRSGAKKSSHPDYKNLVTKDGLWIEDRTTPAWVLDKLNQKPVLASTQDFTATRRPSILKDEKLKPAYKTAIAQTATVAKDEAWQSFFASRSFWTDYRSKKANGQVKSSFPDFKHADGIQALWLDSKSTPSWVAQKLLEETETKSPPRPQQGKRRPSEMPISPVDARWRDLWARNTEWRDYRPAKKAGSVKEKHPDFKSAEGESLWIGDKATPLWVMEQLESMTQSMWQTAIMGSGSAARGKRVAVKKSAEDKTWRSLFEEADLWLDFREAKAQRHVDSSYPDFKQPIENGFELWLDEKGKPDWVSEKLAEADKEPRWEVVKPAPFGDTS